MTTVDEPISRQALLNLATNYSSISEAVMELVDNPFDYRGSRHLVIDVILDRDNDTIVVRDVGGEGMDDQALRDWLNWGQGHTHATQDIGQFHVGGKLAAIFLADGIEIKGRRAGGDTVWRFEDPHWGTRSEFIELEIEQIEPPVHSWAGQLRENLGFVEVTLTDLKRSRHDLTVLRNRLSDTYRTLIDREHCTIFVNGELVQTDDVPWTTDVDVEEIPRTEIAKGVWVSGRIGALDRNKLPKRQGVLVRPGVRTEFNGRKISDGETFGVNLIGRGTSARLYGEISITGGGLLPSQNKTTWDHDHPKWRAIHDLIQPIVERVNKDLEAIAGRRDSSKADVKRAARARKRTVAVLEQIRQVDRHRDVAEEQLVQQVLQFAEEMPHVSLVPLGQEAPRSEWSDDPDGERSILVNADHPLCKQMNRSEAFIFESVLMHLCAEPNDDIPGHVTLMVLDELHWLEEREDDVYRIAPGTDPMSCADAAYAVLLESGAPMHYRDIAARMLEAEIWETDGATPDATVSSILVTDLKENGDASRFVRVERGVYALRSGGRELSP